MEFQFTKKSFIEDSEIYRIHKYKQIFEVDLYEDDNQNLEKLKLLFENNVHQLILHVNKNEKLNFERELKLQSIKYKIFEFDRKNIFFVMESVNRSQELYMIDLFYCQSITNEFVILCLGKKLNVEFEKMNINKIIQLLLGESWVSNIHLDSASACAFIQYDGALLTIAENELDIAELGDK